MAFPYKKAVVIGGSRGTGRMLALGLAGKGVETTVVARGQRDLDTLKAEEPALDIRSLDAAADGAMEGLLRDVAPDLVVLAGGRTPRMAELTDLTWDEFSSVWNGDTKTAFSLVTAALSLPLAPGSAIVSLSSGAALGGSPLSGGYAGAKRMQHFLQNYGQWQSDREKLGLKFYTIYPKQLIAGTQIGDEASQAYAIARGISPEAFMKQWEKPLTAGDVATHVLDLLSAKDGEEAGAYAVNGTGRELMA